MHLVKRLMSLNCGFINTKFVSQHILINYYNVCSYKELSNENETHSIQLEKLLGCSKQQGLALLNKFESLSALDNDRINKVADILEKFDITKEDIYKYPNVLTILPATLEQHALLLQEGGFEDINALTLLKYLTITKMRISLIKTCGYISPHINVAHSFLSHLDPVPPKIAQLILQHTCRWDEEKFIDVYETVLKYFLTWRLDMMPGEIDRVMKTYQRIKHRSFQLMCRTLNILENELGFSKQKIRKNGYLIHSHPDNILNTLQKIKTLGGIDIKTVLSKKPKIMMIPTNTLMKTSRYLEDYGISNEAVQRCLEVFTLASESVQLRLSELDSIPEFRALIPHPRVVRLVHYQHKAKSRLDHLRKLQVRCVSLHVLASSNTVYERYTRDGEDRTRGMDVTHYLSYKLKSSESSLRQMLLRHPFWHHVPLVSIQDTLDCLLELGYTHKEVLCNVHILLYSRTQVEQGLLQLTEREDLSAEQLQVPPVLTGSHRLALCVYFIERLHHFTGDGIWTIQSDSDIDPSIPGI